VPLVAALIGALVIASLWNPPEDRDRSSDGDDNNATAQQPADTSANRGDPTAPGESDTDATESDTPDADTTTDPLVADSGEEGVRKALVARPDCILMDVVMPGMNGFQATRKLSRDATTSGIPVIIITTKDQETDKIWGMRQGAVEYLIKPVEEKRLVEMINKVTAGTGGA